MTLSAVPATTFRRALAVFPTGLTRSGTSHRNVGMNLFVAQDIARDINHAAVIRAGHFVLADLARLTRPSLMD